MNGVAISGKAGAGKNEFAIWLAEELASRGYWPLEMGFAEGPKAELWETRRLRKEDLGGRDALLELAHGRRQKQPHYWVERFERRYVSLSPYGVVPIITDLRYANELEWVRANEFVTVRVDALLLDRAIALLNRGENPAFAESEHETETAMDEEQFDVRFWNPHGSKTLLRHHAFRVADIFDGTAEVRQGRDRGRSSSLPSAPSALSPWLRVQPR